MAVREGSWWSRAWGAMAVSAFAVHLGAAVYEAAVIAPLWSVQPPKSVVAWNALTLKPESSQLFEPLAAVIVLATLMAWISGIQTRGWRRWWLTLALASAGALAAVTFLLVMPAEQDLFGAATRSGGADPALVVAWTGDWLRAAAFRFAALLAGTWSAYRAQLSGILADVPAAVAQPDADVRSTAGGRVRRAREFSFGDEDEPEISLGDEAGPRQRWRGSLPGARRTAKK